MNESAKSAGAARGILSCTDFDNSIRWTEGERLEHLFERRCDQAPDRLAVVTEDKSLTFRQLDDRANQTARCLLDRGLKAGDRVGLLLDKSVHRYVGLLAVLKIGAAYVPLDASFPAERVRFILEDADVGAIVSESRFRESLAAFDVEQVFLDSARADIDAKETSRLADHEKPASGDRLFYIVYTSGTTGKPKGVAIEHSGICNFVRVAGEVYGIREGDRCYQGITLAFDFHVEDLWVPLIAGATLVAGRPGAGLFGQDLHKFLLERRVTVLPCVPTLWATIEQDLPDVRIVLLSGESVPHNLVVRWHREGRSILNAYGPTECSVSSTLRRLVPESPVTVGRPLPTYTVVLLDEDRDAVISNGGIGEIGIAGIGLALGYHKREDLTRQKFIRDFLDLPNNPSRRIYRTGDLGRIREDGELEFHGRIDTQIKLRGYRVELGEIESVLMQLPQVAQCVVHTWEPDPGAVELVAYYTRKKGAQGVSADEISETLRKNLPAYMVPAFVEELPAIPMTANNKADRMNLPPPTGPRFAVARGTYVAPRTETERVLAGALAEVMKIERASVEDDFFNDLGAHSLLMARFAAEVRKRLRISSVSMQDVYQNPTVARLARHLDALPSETSTATERAPLRIPSNLAYYGCGALQLLWYLWWVFVAVEMFVLMIEWTYAAMPDMGETYLRVVAFVAAGTAVFGLLPILAKWLLIGRWKEETIPVWSLRYFRFWVVKTLIRSGPMARLGDPFLNLYLRLLGARVGANAVIHAKLIPVCTDLVSIGANTVVRADAILSGYRAEANWIRTGPIRIGANAFVGDHGVLDIHTVMEDDTQLGHTSSLHEGQRVPRGKRYHGSPARETTADYCSVEPKACTPLRRWTYAVVLLLAGLAAAPVPLIGLYWIFPWLRDYLDFHVFHMADHRFGAFVFLAIERLAEVSFGLFVALSILGLLFMAGVPRFLNLFLRKDKAYVLYGVHYFLHRLIALLSNSVFFNRLFGDSSAIVHYARWIGYRLNEVVQTGSNFGISQRHENPFLCDIGSGTMVSGGLKMVNTTMSSTSFRVGTVRIGEHNYLGNYLHVPAESTVGANVLLATKALVPIEGPVRENVGLLGSPPFEIPRAVARDLEMSRMDDATRLRQLRKKNRYNLRTAVLFVLHAWFVTYLGALGLVAAYLFERRHDTAAVFVAFLATFVLGVFWMWLVERMVLRFGRLKPQVVSMLLHDYFWFHERHWKLLGLWAVAFGFAGTPFKNVFSRLQGVRVGRKVFDDGSYVDEATLIEIGDYTNLNAACVIQPHSLEEGVFKSDHVKIGRGCTLGVASNLHYGVVMGDNVLLAPDSFVMKGEILDSDATWEGNPARSVQGGGLRGPRAEAPGGGERPCASS